MGCGAERAPQFRRESAGRKECADHFSIPFLQEELAVIFVRGVYQEIDIVFPLVAYVQQLPFGEGQQFVGERLVGQVVQEQFSVIVGVVAGYAPLVVKKQFVADVEHDPAVRFLGEKPFAEQARGLDVAGLADPHYFAQELRRVVTVFEYLVADHVVEFLVCKRQGFGRSVDQLLVGEYAQAAAAMGIVAEEFLHEDVRTEGGAIAGAYLEYPVTSFDMQILSAFGSADFHWRSRIVTNIEKYFLFVPEHAFYIFPLPVVGGGLDAQQPAQDEVHVLVLERALPVALAECGARGVEDHVHVAVAVVEAVCAAFADGACFGRVVERPSGLGDDDDVRQAGRVGAVMETPGHLLAPPGLHVPRPAEYPDRRVGILFFHLQPERGARYGTYDLRSVEQRHEVDVPLRRKRGHAMVGRYDEIDSLEDGRAPYLTEKIAENGVDVFGLGDCLR